jgi:hypothetical protein
MTKKQKEYHLIKPRKGAAHYSIETPQLIDDTKVKVTLDGSELPIICAALLNHIEHLPEPNRTVCIQLQQRLLGTYQQNFDWRSGKVAPSYARAVKAQA